MYLSVYLGLLLIDIWQPNKKSEGHSGLNPVCGGFQRFPGDVQVCYMTTNEELDNTVAIALKEGISFRLVSEVMSPLML